MLSVTALVLGAVLAAARNEELTFPLKFKFGVASASYQVEGAWNVSDKSESIWDRFTHSTPSPIEDGSTGDVACDSYHLWEEDVNMVAELGVDFYRISISWPRLIPSGFPDHISEDGKRYYNNLIDGLLAKGIEPVVTLFHWDLPQSLQDLGGWTNPLIVNWFSDYARVCFSLYGDRVKTWLTINEPWSFCDVAYMTTLLPPSLVKPGTNLVGAYICNKNVLLAHAKAWRIYDEEFKPKYHGGVSLANHITWMEAANEDEEEITQLAREYQEGRYAYPIYSKDGGWPPAIEKAIAEFSKKEGYPWSILPTFTQKEIEFIRGTYDFYGINFYASKRVRRGKEGEVLTPWPLGDIPMLNAKLDFRPEWPVVLIYWSLYPEGLRKQLAHLKKQYGDIPILITESGLGTSEAGLDDQQRVNYLRNYMKQVLLSIKEDGVNVTGYTVWTLMDNLEWMSGYKTKFGLYEVDFTSPLRTRTPRASAKYYASVTRARSVNATYNFTSNVAPKTSKPQENTNYIIFGGLIVVVVVGVSAGVVGARLKQKARQEKKHRYAAVNNGDGAENGQQNGGNNNGTEIGVKSKNLLTN